MTKGFLSGIPTADVARLIAYIREHAGDWAKPYKLPTKDPDRSAIDFTEIPPNEFYGFFLLVGDSFWAGQVGRGAILTGMHWGGQDYVDCELLHGYYDKGGYGSDNHMKMTSYLARLFYLGDEWHPIFLELSNLISSQSRAAKLQYFKRWTGDPRQGARGVPSGLQQFAHLFNALPDSSSSGGHSLVPQRQKPVSLESNHVEDGDDGVLFKVELGEEPSTDIEEQCSRSSSKTNLIRARRKRSALARVASAFAIQIPTWLLLPHVYERVGWHIFDGGPKTIWLVVLILLLLAGAWGKCAYRIYFGYFRRTIASDILSVICAENDVYLRSIAVITTATAITFLVFGRLSRLGVVNAAAALVVGIGIIGYLVWRISSIYRVIGFAVANILAATGLFIIACLLSQLVGSLF